jgi:hypothetical protein
MIILGVDYHPEFQQIACVDTESGEFEEGRLQNRDGTRNLNRHCCLTGVNSKPVCRINECYRDLTPFFGLWTTLAARGRAGNSNRKCGSPDYTRFRKPDQR